MNGLEIGKISGFLTHFRPPEQQILDQGQGPDPELSHKTTFVIWRDEKVKNFALFFQIRVLSTRSDSSSKWDVCTNSGRSHGGENPKESRKYAKKEVVWSGT